jgi:hypothetical protein
MKNAISPCLLLCLAVPAAAQTELKCPDLAGKVRFVKVLHMQPVRRGEKWLDGSPASALADACDKYGMKTEEDEYDAKSLLRKTVYEYREKAAASAICEGLRKGGTPDPSSAADQGSAVADFCSDNGKKDFGAVFVYDAPAQSGKTADRKPLHRIFRLYDKHGFVTEERSIDPDGNLESVTLRSYDKDNDLTEKTLNDPDGRQLKRETYVWNKPTASRTVSVYGDNTMLSEKTVYEQREDGTLRREVRTAYDSGEQPVSRSETYCDARGRPQKELDYDADSVDPSYQYSYSFKYDKAGNWTERRKTRALVYDGNLMPDTQYAPDITRREIQYY